MKKNKNKTFQAKDEEEAWKMSKAKNSMDNKLAMARAVARELKEKEIKKKEDAIFEEFKDDLINLKKNL